MNQITIAAAKPVPYQAPAFPYLCNASGEPRIFVSDTRACGVRGDLLTGLDDLPSLRKFSELRKTSGSPKYITPCDEALTFIVDNEVGSYNNSTLQKFPCIIDHSDGKVYLCFAYNVRCELTQDEPSVLGPVIDDQLNASDIVKVLDRMELTLSN